MRLILLREAINTAYNTFSYKAYSSNGFYFIDQVDKAKIAILELLSVDFFNDQDKILLEPILNSTGTKISYNDNDLWGKTTGLLNGISYTLRLLNDWFSKFMPQEQDPDNIVNIKLPQIQEFKDLENISKKLSGPFSIIVKEVEGGHIEIKQFDHGSLWIVIGVGSLSAVMLVGAIAWSAAVIAKKWNELNISIEVARTAKLKNDAIEELVKYQKDTINQLAQQEADLIANKCFSTEDSEKNARLREALKDISELLIKGVEIQPALCAPENVSNLFPNYKMLPLIESKISKLTQG